MKLLAVLPLLLGLSTATYLNVAGDLSRSYHPDDQIQSKSRDDWLPLHGSAGQLTPILPRTDGDEQWYTEIIIEDDQLNFGNARPTDLVRGLTTDPLNSMCPPAGPSCDKRRSDSPFKTFFQRRYRVRYSIVERDVYPEVDESAYSDEEERDALISALALTWQNVTQTEIIEFPDERKLEFLVPLPATKGRIEENRAPSRITARRRSTDGAYGANIELRFVVVGGEAPKSLICDSLNVLTAASDAVGILFAEVGPIRKVLGVVSGCCSSSNSKCSKKALKALAKAIG